MIQSIRSIFKLFVVRFVIGNIIKQTGKPAVYLSIFQLVFAMAFSKEKRLSRWYFGGLASAGAACCTHPLDLLKV